MTDRRGFLALAAAAAGSAALRAEAAPAPAWDLLAPEVKHDEPGGGAMRTRTIPKTGEALPVVGLGTWQTFDVGASAKERTALREVLQRFFAAGGRLIDSSPMYGRAEAVVGDLLRALDEEKGGSLPDPFLASKVWTRGREQGIAEMRRSIERMTGGVTEVAVKPFDLMQIHNLLDWKTHLPVLREWKKEGKIRYLGITHYQLSSFDEMERLMREESLDFVQLPYSIRVREAEERLLPAAAETKTAVIVMRPFEEGTLFRTVRGKKLPEWAGEFDCTSWAQFFLKFILGHPAVTAVIPATSKPDHLSDNVKAGSGRLPDEAMRRRMAAFLDS